MNDGRRFLLCGAFTMIWATGCADPCVDDGVSQDEPANCPQITGGGSTDGTDPTTTAVDDSGTSPSGCNDGVQNGDETDVDCGGSCDDKCGGGQGCGGNDDCESNECGAGMTCDDPGGCSDGVMGGSETDVDCGGPACDPCDDGEACLVPSDCVSGNCDVDFCIAPTCSDGVLNGDETDVDCGGPDCDPCENGEMCNEGGDCQSMMCEDGTCGGPTCSDGMHNGNETDVDCGGPDCDPCPDGDDCVENTDCISQICGDKGSTCLAPSCNDGVINGDETDLDCGGACGPTCEPGEGCLVGMDCLSFGCDAGTNLCNDFLTVDAAPSCSNFGGAPVPLSATAAGGSGMYSFAWTPDDGSLATPNMAMTDASPAGFQSYLVTVDDGFSMAQDSVVVVDSAPFDLENNCVLYTADFNVSLSGLPASIAYDMGGTRACEQGNNEFGLHLCEGVVFENTRLQGTFQVVDDPLDDDDWMGLVWGAQDNANFYSLTWKAGDQFGVFGCDAPSGIIVRRVEGPAFGALTIDDFFCEPDTPRSTLLLGPGDTTTDGWEEGQSYTVTIDFTDLGSDISIVRDSDLVEIVAFTVNDTTFTDGFFGSITASQESACVGPLLAECL